MLRSQFGLAVVALGAALMISTARPDARRGGQFRSTVHTVEVHATVRGADGQFISGLTKDDFDLLDNGKRREISVFAGEVQPIAAALVLDRSGSVARQANQIAGSAATRLTRKPVSMSSASGVNQVG